MTPKKSSKGFLVYFVIALMIIMTLVMLLNKDPAKSKDVDYGTIMGYFDNLEVEKYTLDLGTGKLTINVKGQKEHR